MSRQLRVHLGNLRLLNFLLEIEHDLFVVIAEESDDSTSLSSTTCSSRSMRVLLDCIAHLPIDNERDCTSAIVAAEGYPTYHPGYRYLDLRHPSRPEPRCIRLAATAVTPLAVPGSCRNEG